MHRRSLRTCGAGRAEESRTKKHLVQRPYTGAVTVVTRALYLFCRVLYGLNRTSARVQDSITTSSMRGI